MSRTSKLLLGVLASMMVCWPLICANELDPTKQEDHAGFGPAARQVTAGGCATRAICQWDLPCPAAYSYACSTAASARARVPAPIRVVNRGHGWGLLPV